MSIFEPAPSPWPARMLSVLRIVAAVVFISVGTMKLYGFPPPPAMMPPITPMTQLWIAGGSALSLDAMIARSKGGHLS